MSTDRKRLSSAIQRIAREDPDIRDIISDFKNRGGIGSTSATVAGADDGRQICCDGSSSNNSNPGSETRDPSEGGQDASDGLNPDDPADIGDMGPGSLAGLTDCATGEPVCFDGADWLPPEGWDSPTSPPFAADYEEGAFWYSNTYEMSGLAPGSLCASIHPLSTSNPDARYERYTRSNSSVSCIRVLETSSGTEVEQIFAALSLLECSGQTVCDEPPPLDDSWPSDGCINLAVKGGKFVASKYDPDVSSGNGWLKGKDEVELCDGQGNSFTVRASGSVEGGWKTISAQNPGDGYLYDATGKQIARISGSEYSDPNV